MTHAYIRRGLALGALVGALALAPAAGAAVRTYEGTLTDNPSAAVTLKVKKQDGKRFVTFFKATNVPISCNEGTVNATLGGVSYTGKEKVKDTGRFTAKASNGVQTFKITGKVRKSSAKGTLRYFGFTQVDDQTYGCDSGTRDWRAKR